MIADDPTTPGEIEAKQVLDAFVRETTALVDLYVDGEVISTTGEHPFWTPDKGWVEAKDLQAGSLLQTEDGRIIDVDRVEKREGQFEVYNFKVEGFHTYYVSDLGILVHNANCVPTNPITIAKLPTKGKIRYVPPENWHSSNPLPRGPNKGYVDKFGNEWVKGPSRTDGQPFEWDVQLGRNATPGVQPFSPDGKHLNVSLDGKITH